MNTATEKTVQDWVGNYGPSGRRGIISEHVGAAERAGGRAHVTASGRMWITDGKGAAILVVCSELVEIATEDGPIVGRCGLAINADWGTCTTHYVDMQGTCEHGLSAGLCAGPGHYPMDR
jgi:hypothetical protein